MTFLPHLRTAAFAILALGLAVTTASAAERRFTYSYETTTSPKGEWEYEQWMTWKHYDNKDRFDFRHEFEYGITDTFVGVPIKLGANGMEQILEITLTTEESAALNKSAGAVRDLVEAMARLAAGA